MKQTGARIWKDIREYWMAAVVLLVYTIAVNLIFHNFCPMVIVSGLPCPGCGLTRSIVCLISGRLSQSLYINPMGIPIACILIYFFWNRYITGRKAKGMTVLITCVVFMLLVLYICRMYMFFPNRVPYVYTENNILSRYFSIYEQILHGFRIL
ncbi:MAG: DUF2752 domain-containing protein [Lachnospiraceae bacterium]|nr:DUF2752 domain-containing protein [Lachnospiraceae bacterium]